MPNFNQRARAASCIPTTLVLFSVAKKRRHLSACIFGLKRKFLQVVAGARGAGVGVSSRRQLPSPAGCKLQWQPSRRWWSAWRKAWRRHSTRGGLTRPGAHPGRLPHTYHSEQIYAVGVCREVTTRLSCRRARCRHHHASDLLLKRLERSVFLSPAPQQIQCGVNVQSHITERLAEAILACVMA